jgi:hypothetical protein
MARLRRRRRAAHAGSFVRARRKSRSVRNGRPGISPLADVQQEAERMSTPWTTARASVRCRVEAQHDVSSISPCRTASSR